MLSMKKRHWLIAMAAIAAMALILLLWPSPAERASRQQTATDSRQTSTGDSRSPSSPTAESKPALRDSNSPLPLVEDSAALAKWCGGQLQAARGALLTLEEFSGPADETGFLNPLDELLISIDNLGGVATLYEYVHPEPQMREEARQCSRQLQELVTDISLSRPVYDGLQRVDGRQLNSAAQRYRQHLLRDYHRSGVSLPPERREKIRTLRQEILELGQEFSGNIGADRRTVSFSDPSMLQGLPEDYLAAHPADDEGLIHISTDYPDFLPVMRYADSGDLRYRLYREFLNRASPQNGPVLKKLIEKRAELATLLGYENYAAYEMETRMVGTTNAAHQFIDRISRSAQPRASRDYERLLARLQQVDPDATEVANWQKSWLDTKIKREEYDLDPLEVRQYFPYANVSQGIFGLLTDLFGIRLEPWDTPVWHPDVQSYELYEGTRLIGRIYLDMHPRADKYSHAAHFGIRTGVRGKQLPVAALVCNFPRPDDPGGGLMEHSQVETFLHEFGHLLHSLFGGHQPWSNLSGIATEHDFVEAPSQMLEEWVWDYPTLATFAVNAAGETIPKSLVGRMRHSRYFGRGLWIRNQMFYAALSLFLYSTAPEKIDLDRDTERLQNYYSPFAYIKDTAFYNNFGHLYGYGSSYYTYMWSLVIATDLFSVFRQNGLRDRETAMRYRELVLEPGGSQDATELIEAFLGRPYNFQAFKTELDTDQ